VSATVYEILCNTQVCNKYKAIYVNMWISLRPKFQNKVNNTSITPTIRYRHMCLDASCLTPTTRPQWLCQRGRSGMIWSHQCSHFFLFLVSYFAMLSHFQDFTAQMADKWIWIWNIATIILIWKTGIFKKKKNLSQCHSVHHKPHTDQSGIEPRPPCRSWWQLSEQWHGHRWLSIANNSNIWQQQNVLSLALLILGTEVSCVINFLLIAWKFLYVYNP